MAKVFGPLFSLGASGTIAKTITYGVWKGIKTARERVTPSNPRSTAQTAQRNIMAVAVSFWRGSLIGTDGKSAWNREATASGRPQSGFNAFTSSATKIAAQDPDASMVVGVSDSSVSNFSLTLSNLDDGATADETGNFDCAYGASPNQMLSLESDVIVAGIIQPDIGVEASVGDVIYMQVTKSAGTVVAAKRSGIFKITLT